MKVIDQNHAPQFPLTMRFKSYKKVKSDHKCLVLNSSTTRVNSPDKGFTFGMSRDAYDKVFMKERPYVCDDDMPGPGQYKLDSFVNKIVSRGRH